MKDLYVVSCCRTAVGSFGGSLKDTPATDLGAIIKLNNSCFLMMRQRLLTGY